MLLATEASAMTEAGHDREAVAPYERALAIFEKTLGPAHPQVGVLAFNLGAVYLRLADYPAALAAYRRAGDISKNAMGEASSLFRNARSGEGEALERLGRDPRRATSSPRCWRPMAGWKAAAKTRREVPGPTPPLRWHAPCLNSKPSRRR